MAVKAISVQLAQMSRLEEANCEGYQRLSEGGDSGDAAEEGEAVGRVVGWHDGLEAGQPGSNAQTHNPG